MFGLLDQEIAYIQEALNHFEEIEKAVVFGSRAAGNYNEGSDVDIAVFGAAVTCGTLYCLHELLNEEFQLPYTFDFTIYECIQDENLKNHIDTIGQELYFKKERV